MTKILNDNFDRIMNMKQQVVRKRSTILSQEPTMRKPIAVAVIYLRASKANQIFCTFNQLAAINAPP